MLTMLTDFVIIISTTEVNMKEDTKSLPIYLSTALYTEFKIACVLDSISMNEKMRELISQYLAEVKEANKLAS